MQGSSAGLGRLRRIGAPGGPGSTGRGLGYGAHLPLRRLKRSSEGPMKSSTGSNAFLLTKDGNRRRKHPNEDRRAAPSQRTVANPLACSLAANPAGRARLRVQPRLGASRKAPPKISPWLGGAPGDPKEPLSQKRAMPPPARLASEGGGQKPSASTGRSQSRRGCLGAPLCRLGRARFVRADVWRGARWQKPCLRQLPRT